ncbi:MAG: oligosaccharide flippase family protein [Candidatus Hydrogenedentes bacterium]|nr:oligosaccharide flippase family protein [Candidatus Hydrogenedentota bacterium]
MSGTSRTFSNAAIYAIGIIINRGVVFALIALYTRAFSVEEYANFELAATTQIFMIVFFDLGLNPALVRYFHLHDEKNHRDLFGTTVSFLMLWALLLCALIFVYRHRLSSFVFGSPDMGLLLILVQMQAAFTVLSNLPLAWFRARERSLHFMLLNLVRAVIGPCAIAVFLLVFKWGLPGVILGDICGLAALTLAGLIANARWYRPILRWSVLRPMLRFGLPLIPMGVGGALLTVSDRYFLNSWVNKEELAVYGVAAKIGLMVVIVSQAIQTAYPPYAFRLAKVSDAPKHFEPILRQLLIAMASVAVCVTAASKEILWILAPTASYGNATYFVPWLAFSSACDGACLMLMTSFAITHRTGMPSVIVILAGITKVGLIYLLVPARGGMGAAEATALAYGVELILVLWITQRCYPIPHDWPRMTALFGIILGALWATSHALQWNPVPSIAARAGIVCLFAGGCVAIILRREERARIVCEAERYVRKRC